MTTVGSVLPSFCSLEIAAWQTLLVIPRMMEY